MHVHVCKPGLASIECMMSCLQEKFLNDAREAIGAMMNTQVEAPCSESRICNSEESGTVVRPAATTTWT